jgi:hypothetical protein
MADGKHVLATTPGRPPRRRERTTSPTGRPSRAEVILHRDDSRASLLARDHDCHRGSVVERDPHDAALAIRHPAVGDRDEVELASMRDEAMRWVEIDRDGLDRTAGHRDAKDAAGGCIGPVEVGSNLHEGCRFAEPRCEYAHLRRGRGIRIGRRSGVRRFDGSEIRIARSHCVMRCARW